MLRDYYNMSITKDNKQLQLRPMLLRFKILHKLPEEHSSLIRRSADSVIGLFGSKKYPLQESDVL
ncbi:hypothetical protein MHIR_DE00208 [Candidatus Doolittlea endobia]|uniref:Uncharacterized protein n=1 Tax=Candidatus Doolittlea endobia TaxID=1778262 RepID=A0A143WS70_9ENTR|nr:hypothetical protein MHIR_DE00208 [Candidatus Doolittlea endobia]